MNTFKTLTSIAALVALAACGGSSSSGGGGGGGGGESRASYTQLSDTGEALLNSYGDTVFGNDYFDVDELPDSGSASYSGAAAMRTGPASIFTTDPQDLVGDFNTLGELAMEVNFADDTLEGTIDNMFNNNNGARIAGELTLTGDLDRNTDQDFDFPVFGNVTGNVRGNTVDATFSADVYGDDGPDVVYGLFGGTYAGSGNNTNIIGAFLGEAD